MNRPVSRRPPKKERVVNRRNTNKSHIFIEENARIALTQAIENFLVDDSPEMSFPPTLTKTERAFIHKYVIPKDISSKSAGKGNFN